MDLKTVNATTDIGFLSTSAYDAMRYKYIFENDLKFTLTEHWYSTKKLTDIKPPKDWTIAYLHTSRTLGLIAPDGGFLSIGYNNSLLYVDASALTTKRAKELLKVARKLAPESPMFKVSKDENMINVLFWTSSSDGPFAHMRSIAAPAWNDITTNYTSRTHDDLDALLKRKFDSEQGAGKLILWTGVPGTGKTFALRTIGREWKDWASLHYIVDPEAFFNSSAAYMLEVLMRTDPKPDMWKVLVFEDTGSILSKDARAKTGQGLSRLLNICDGFIGQGLKLLILVTSNEDINDLHPAVTRPGRCIANITFSPLTRPEIIEWCEKKNLEAPKGNATLAELYEIHNKSKIGNEVKRERIGFAGKAKEPASMDDLLEMSVTQAVKAIRGIHEDF